MATRNIVPRGDGEGNIGTALKNWLKGWFKDVFVSGVITDGSVSLTVSQLVASVFGQLFSFNSSIGETSTTLSTYTQKLRLTTPTLVAGKYKIEVQFSYAMSVTNQDFNARVQVGDTVEVFGLTERVPQSGQTMDYHRSGFYVYTLALGGVLNIDLDFAVSGGTGYIRDAILNCYRVE